MNKRACLGSEPLTTPVYAIIGTLIPVSLWKQYMERRSIQLSRVLMDTSLLHDAVHGGEMRRVSPHPVDENEKVDIVG